MSSSRAVLVLGMHRSGTSLVTRGLQALGVYLGNDFLETRPDNPTGYWEDKSIVDINERVLGVLGLTWEDISLIERRQLEQPQIRALQLEAINYVSSSFASQPLWGFKDPRAIRLLPFWRSVLHDCGSEEAYLVAIRNPLSVAASLFQRQAMEPAAAHRLWLVYIIPFLRDIIDKPFVVVDYDLFMHDPHQQLERIARNLKIPLTDKMSSPEIERFIAEFLAVELRHTVFSRHDFDARTGVTPLTREAYLWLYELATDQLEPRAPRFWSAWESIQCSLETLLKASGAGP
jgi:hypothetical protein